MTKLFDVIDLPSKSSKMKKDFPQKVTLLSDFPQNRTL